MSKEYVSLLDGVRHIKGMHVGQDIKKLTFIRNEESISLSDICHPVKYVASNKKVEITGVIFHFPTLNNFLKKFIQKKSTVSVSIYETIDKKVNHYLYPVKLIDYKVTYNELSRSEVLLIFEKRK
jgi:hypothetical protein